jgi:Flp pilus assembly protein TadD/peroxiredoxin
MGRRPRKKVKLSRRDFLGSLRWAPMTFLAAPLYVKALPNFWLGAHRPETSLGFIDDRLIPHYPKKSPLEDVLRLVAPGSDQYLTEKYALEISRVLLRWSEELQKDSSGVAGVETFLSAAMEGGGLHSPQEKTLRSEYGIQTVRRIFPAGGKLGREPFLDELRRYFLPFAAIETAEFQITEIEEKQATPLKVRIRVRYDLLGEVEKGGREERIGYWDMVWQQEAGAWRATRWTATEETLNRARQPIFLDVSSQAFGQVASYPSQLLCGVDYWRTILDGATGMDVYGNNGIAAGDFDNDGFDDLYVSQPAGLPNRLYKNRGDGTFEDVTEAAGVGVLDGTACALFADFENRGLQDLLVVCTNGPLLFVNQGNGKYALKQDAFRFSKVPAGTFTHAAAADYDGDGRLDIYFCLYSYYLGLDQYHYPAPYFDARNGPPNFLLHNEGHGTFADRTEAAGLDAENDRYSFACAWGDSNGDGHPDLYVANDFGRSNLYRNNGDGTFSAVSSEAHANDVGAGMSATWLDFDGDGKQDIYVSNMWSAAGSRVTSQKIFQAKEPDEIRQNYSRHMRGNWLYRNLGAGNFANASMAAGVAMGRWAWGSDSWDFDHDGYADLYVTNGYISGADRQDVSSFFWRQVVGNSPATETPAESYERGWNAINELIRSDATWNGFERNVFYRNNQDGTFSEVSGVAGLDFADDSRSFALADLDRDGRLEMVLKNRTAPQLRVLRNAMSEIGNAISFRLQGTKSNRDAIGAAVTIEAGDRRQTKLLQAGSGFLSQHSKELFFGIGNGAGPVRARVRWPSGATQIFEGLPINHCVELREGVQEPGVKPFASPSRAYLQRGEKFPPKTLPQPVLTWLIQPLPAPDFELPDTTGKTRQLSGFRGRFVLLQLWCAAAKQSVDQLRLLQKYRDELQREDIEIACVNLDGPQHANEIQRLAELEKFSFPVLLANEETAGIYNLFYRFLFDRRQDLGLTTAFLLNRDGMVVKVYQGEFQPAQTLTDVAAMPKSKAEFQKLALPMAGTAYLTEFQRNDFTYGVAFYQRGYLDAATASFKEVIAAKPDNPEANYNLGTLYLAKGDLKTARGYLENAAKLRAEYAEAWNNLGMISAQQGLEDEAIQDFQKSLSIRPTYLTALLNYGNLLRRKGDLAGAGKLLAQALKEKPEDADANYSMGMLLARQGQLEAASAHLEKAILYRPDYAEAWNNLGVMLVQQGKYSEAQEKFETCMRVAPKFDQAYLNLARLYALRNDKAKARDVLEKLLQEQPGHKLAQQTLEMLN